MDSSAPEGAHCFYNGQYCKVGRHNKVFVHRNGEWVFTKGITVNQIATSIIKQEQEEYGKTKTGRNKRRDRSRL